MQSATNVPTTDCLLGQYMKDMGYKFAFGEDYHSLLVIELEQKTKLITGAREQI